LRQARSGTSRRENHKLAGCGFASLVRLGKFVFRELRKWALAALASSQRKADFFAEI
jgi:hypothetical protein